MLKSLRAGVTQLRDLGMNKANCQAAVERGFRVCNHGRGDYPDRRPHLLVLSQGQQPDEMRRAVRDQVRGVPI
jgi:hypothetical protein